MSQQIDPNLLLPEPPKKKRSKGEKIFIVSFILSIINLMAFLGTQIVVADIYTIWYITTVICGIAFGVGCYGIFFGMIIPGKAIPKRLKWFMLVVGNELWSILFVVAYYVGLLNFAVGLWYFSVVVSIIIDAVGLGAWLFGEI